MIKFNQTFPAPGLPLRGIAGHMSEDMVVGVPA